MTLSAPTARANTRNAVHPHAGDEASAVFVVSTHLTLVGTPETGHFCHSTLKVLGNPERAAERLHALRSSGAVGFELSFRVAASSRQAPLHAPTTSVRSLRVTAEELHFVRLRAAEAADHASVLTLPQRALDWLGTLHDLPNPSAFVVRAEQL